MQKAVTDFQHKIMVLQKGLKKKKKSGVKNWGDKETGSGACTGSPHKQKTCCLFIEAAFLGGNNP